MSLNQFRYLAEVAQCGSIRIAAERLHVAPSAISRHIQTIEDELGTHLFERHARGVVLTTAGQIYVQYARLILRERDRVRSDIDDLRKLRRGHIRVHSVDGIVAGPLSTAIHSFRLKYPGVTFRLVSTGTQTVAHAVRDGEADVGVAFQPTPERDVKVAHRIPDPLQAVVAPGHPLAKAKAVSLAEVLRYPVALPEATFGIRKLVDARCRAIKAHPQPALETNSIEALRGFARAGAGVTMLPYLSAKREVDLGFVKALPFSDAVLRKSSTEICVQERRLLPIAAQEFLEHLYLTFRDWQGQVRYREGPAQKAPPEPAPAE
jgi:DNA-binding transcriptional LysR family regulator